MLSEVLTTVTQVGMVMFIVGSMAAMGLGLTLERILSPLRDLRMVILLLAANFIAVPVAAIAAANLLPMDEASSTAVIIVGCCAGAPFLPRLAQMAEQDPAFAVGGMVPLMVATVLYRKFQRPVSVSEHGPPVAF